MDCKNFQAYSSVYIDNKLSEEEKSDFENHIKKCTNCNIAFENMKTIVESVSMFEEIELPANFSNELHEKLLSAKKHKSKPALFNKNKILNGVAAILLVSVLSLTLVNNFLNHKKGIDLYGRMGDTAKEKENINVSIIPDETKEETLDKTDDGESIMSLETAPSDKNKMCKDILNGVEGNAKENDDESRKFIARSGNGEKSVADESVQSLPDNKNLNKIFNSIAILALIMCTVILIYRVPKR
ncbi:MAG TPA: zf-HC2 domain-containing protein [Oscillospiraceae bacterium]|nr:zf-HC2 domain-containing protein [Oscillospiraceae bacterium]